MFNKNQVSPFVSEVATQLHLQAITDQHIELIEEAGEKARLSFDKFGAGSSIYGNAVSMVAWHVAQEECENNLKH